MLRRLSGVALVTLLVATTASASQFPMLDAVAQNVIQKYQQATCEQLWDSRGQPKSASEQEAITLLQGDPAMRAAFMAQVAVPVANKLFECGLIP